MKAKNVISILIVSVMFLGLLTGCSSETEGKQENDTQQETDTGDDAVGEEPAEDTETSSGISGNTLVVYYSATGNTEEVANTIAEAAGGSLFELEPEEPYSGADLDWTDKNSRVSVEHENEDERDVALTADTADNWDSYDTVFIGYPIWWGIAAWPVDTFIKANDFTGKTVIPFRCF